MDSWPESEVFMTVTFGSARHDENGNLNGKAGDQLQKGNGNDFVGEVSMQPYYLHKYGWYGLRFKNIAHRHKMAERMVAASNNKHIGYSQAQRLGVVNKGIDTAEDTNCDCSSLVRRCFIEATGKDPGNFTTANEKAALMATGLVEEIKVTQANLMTGDILVSKRRGHTVVVVLGKSPDEPNVTYYPAYKGTSISIVTALAKVGERDTSMAHRKKIAAANGVNGYRGSAAQNIKLLGLLKSGKLIKA